MEQLQIQDLYPLWPCNAPLKFEVESGKPQLERGAPEELDFLGEAGENAWVPSGWTLCRNRLS